MDGKEKPIPPRPDLPPVVSPTPIKPVFDSPQPSPFQSPPPAPPPGRKSNRVLIICLIAALVVAAGTVSAAVALTLSGSDDSGSSNDPALADGEGSGTDAGVSDPVDGSDPAPEYEPPAKEPPAYDPPASDPVVTSAWRTDQKGGWTAFVPKGGGWSPMVVDEHVPNRRTVSRQYGPGSTLAVYSTPADRPDPGLLGSDIASSSYLVNGAQEIVMEPGVGTQFEPACGYSRCIDYLIDSGSGGFAVLVSAPTVAEAQEIGRATAKSIG